MDRDELVKVVKEVLNYKEDSKIETDLYEAKSGGYEIDIRIGWSVNFRELEELGAKGIKVLTIAREGYGLTLRVRVDNK